MAQIKTVTTTSGENTITFDSFYPFVWIRNTGDNDIIAANYSGAQAGDENTVSIKAGEVAMIQAETENVYIIGATTAEIHAQGFAECPFKRGLKGGEEITVTPLSVSENGTYTAPTGTAYSPVTVDVQEQPWEPLEDGYSNFWFELTDDTLSPWLNFSAKNNDAVIDWGDGSGEVALDTLTPTHTYAKAGRYVVKVKGVTGIARQHQAPFTPYVYTLIDVELASEVVVFSDLVFNGCVSLRNVVGYGNVRGGYSWFDFCGALRYADFSNVNDFTNSAFYRCGSLETLKIDSAVTIGVSAFNLCTCLRSITLPSTITSIAGSAFRYCGSLVEIHVQATTPPTLGPLAFDNLPTDYIIYVPVGTGDTYKAAWSAYADHILEEGQTVTRAMQRKFAKEAKAIEDTGDMR